MTSTNAAPTDPARFPRRTLRRQETRARIVAAASRLFRQVGYADTTMTAIAEAADVHVATLFTHFKAKRDLAATLGEAAIDQLEGLIAKSRGRTPFFTFFRAVVESAAKSYAANEGPNIAFGHELRLDPELAFGWLSYERRQTQMLAGYIAADHNLDSALDPRPMLIASLLVASNTLAHDRWQDSGGRLNLIQETLNSLDVALNMAEMALRAGDGITPGA